MRTVGALTAVNNFRFLRKRNATTNPMLSVQRLTILQPGSGRTSQMGRARPG
jgi:hypothetical protein